MTSYLGLTVLAAAIMTLSACGGSPEAGQQPERTDKTSAEADSTVMNGAPETTGMEGGMSGMGSMTVPDNVPRLPPVKAYYEGEEVFFVHPEASDEETADLLTDMMASPVLVVPELEQVPEEALSKVYVFTNGNEGDGPLGFQPDVFDSAPGDENYSPLRRLYLVTWKDASAAGEIKTLQGIREARESGKIEIERQDTVINEPFLTWPGGRR
ncbi:hypothetical protein BH24ACT21_BH24ACT21_16530 [soil metagenome]